ncbi:MAG: hypothetical protein KZQ69_11830, partial [gamma proteobacterium symbiont of Bathyaustriella thionipta]|nr:hypothetical protein [gamma proteobacterium symbiont of Bathyaustriella thionipta]
LHFIRPFISVFLPVFIIISIAWNKRMDTNSGINAIVHGHRNLYYGQRIMLRKGIINFECDTSLDINTRKKEGVVRGLGAAVTIIHPEKLVLGISSDYPYIKVFEPELTKKLCND